MSTTSRRKAGSTRSDNILEDILAPKENFYLLNSWFYIRVLQEYMELATTNEDEHNADGKSILGTSPVLARVDTFRATIVANCLESGRDSVGKNRQNV